MRAALTPRTKAVIVVHLAGWPCDMKAIAELTRSRGIWLIEDCAQAHGAEIDREMRRHQCFSCRPIRRWRTCEVSVSITDTVMTISTRMADTSE